MTGKEYRISQGYKICLVRDFVKKNDELKDSQSHPKWDYLNNVRRLFETAGLDHYLNSDINMITFKKFFGEYVRNIEITNAKSKSSLTNYVHFPIVLGKQIYWSSNQPDLKC